MGGHFLLYKLRRHGNESNEVGMKLKFTRNANSVGNEIVIKFTRSTGIRSSSSSGHEIRVIVFSPFTRLLSFSFTEETQIQKRDDLEREEEEERKTHTFLRHFRPKKKLKPPFVALIFECAAYLIAWVSQPFLLYCCFEVITGYKVHSL